MKITKARLKQIIQEELQALNEDKHTQSSWDDASRTRSAQRDTQGSTERLSRFFDFFHAPTFGDPTKRAAEMADTYNRQSGKKPAAQPEAEPEDLGPGMSVDDQFVASGDTGAQQSMAVSGADVDVAETDPTVTGATQVADILSGRPEGAEGAFGDADGKEKPAKPARVARKGPGATRREINKMWKAGEFGPYEGGKKGTKSYAKWVKLRRTLANKGEAAARAALGGAGAPEQQRDVAKKRQNKAALDGEGGYADYAEKGAEPAVAAPEAPTIEDPAIAADIERIEASKRALGRLNSTEQLRDLPVGMRRRINRIAGRYEERGYPRGEAIELARGILGSRLQNKIKRLELEPGVQRMLAKRARGAGEARGRELAATARDRGTETPSMALGRGVPGGMRESVEKLTNLIAEEFKEALNEDKFKTDPKTEKIVSLLADQAPVHTREIAALIMQVSPRTPEKAAKRVNKFLKSNNEDDKRFDKIIAALKQQAKNTQGSGDFAKKKQKFLKSVGARSMGKPGGAK